MPVSVASGTPCIKERTILPLARQTWCIAKSVSRNKTMGILCRHEWICLFVTINRICMTECYRLKKKAPHVLAQFNYFSQKIISWMCIAGGLWTSVVYSVWKRIFNTERYGRTKHKLHTKWKAACGWTRLRNRVQEALYTFFFQCSVAVALANP